MSFGRGGTRCLDRVRGRAELVGRDVGDSRGLAGRVRGMPWCPAQISGRGHRMARRRASLGHGDLAARPRPPEFNRPPGSRILRPKRLEEPEDVRRARCRPQGEELVIRIGESSAAADRHETRVADLREDHAITLA